MVIAELYKTEMISRHGFVAPFVVRLYPSRFTVASYWHEVFGAPEESATERKFIAAVSVWPVRHYDQADSIAACLALSRSFYWDDSNQVLYVHMGSSESPFSEAVSAGVAYGYSDQEVVYIDDIEYLPLIQSIPSLAQQQDLVDYNKLAFLSGSVQFGNAGGKMDYLIAAKMYGSFARFFSLALVSGKLNYARSDMTLRATMYVEDYGVSMKRATVDVQDVRKFFDQQCPTEKYGATEYPNIEDADIGSIIPLAYGAVRGLKAVCTNKKVTSGDVTYRCAQELTALGNVYVINGNNKTLVTPSTVDLAHGAFGLTGEDARDENGNPLEALVESATGIAVTYASDVIKDLNYRYGGIEFVSTYYDLTEWAEEEVKLAPVGVVFTDQAELYDQIQKVQQGANVGFRYEINAEGKRTIRVDDWSRDSEVLVENVDILNIDEMPESTDSSNLAGTVVVRYNQDLEAEVYVEETDSSNLEHVIEAYQQQPTVTVPTFLTTQEDAQARAAFVIEHQGDIHPGVELELMGDKYLGLRIFDILYLELTPGFVDISILEIIGRQYIGICKASVVGIDPDNTAKVNKVRAVIIEQYNDAEQLADEEGIPFILSNGAPVI